MHDIFISYSRHDLDQVKSIKEELDALGFDCWMDLKGIVSGARKFSSHLIEAIDKAQAMLFFLSADSQTSEWALKEIDYATSEHKHVVLVRFNDDQMTKEFRFEFGRADIIDWREPEQRAKLLSDLGKWSGKPIVGDFGGSPNARPEALYQLALRHKTGNGVARDLERAAKLFLNAAKQGYPPAQNDYGVCLQNGQGTGKDATEAVIWYRRAAKAGYAPAQLNYGYCLQLGEGIDKDLEGAAYWYELAANQGNAWAQCNLGMCYEEGQGVPEDEDAARYWYGLAAKQGDATAAKGLRRLSRKIIPSSVACGSVFGDTDDDCSMADAGDGESFGGVSGGGLHGRIGEYSITRVLGIGQFGKVYLGEDGERRRAFKCIHCTKDGGQLAGVAARYVRVCQALRKIDSHVVGLASPTRVFRADDADFVSDGGVRGGQWVVEMLYAPGMPSTDWVKTLDVTTSGWQDRVFDVCGQIADALDHLHAAGLVHRDVAPANIVVHPNPEGTMAAWLCDFDFMAFRSDLQRRPKGIAGTPEYIAPEVLAALSAADGLSDQYSLACVLYRLLSGRPPYEYADELDAIDFKGMEGDFTPLPKGGELWNSLSETPPAVRVLNEKQNAALAQALSVKKSLRFPSCVQLVEAVKNGLPVHSGIWPFRWFRS